MGAERDVTMQGRAARVVIIGGGFGGLNAAKQLRRAPVEVTLIDRRNHHLFQPLLYQVATAALSPADIAAPIRRVLSRQRNTTVILGEVTAIDVVTRRVRLDDGGAIEYDYLIVASGATHSYFGHDEWERFAPGLKTLDDATEIRRRFLLAFEMAERESDSGLRRARLTFIVVGAGPTGVELAGTMSELARRAIPADFRLIDTTSARVILLEALDRVLPAMPPDLSKRAQRDLEDLGVEVRLSSRVTQIDEGGVMISDERIAAHNVIWAAGVQASPLGALLGAETDRHGRVVVQPDLSIEGHPEVFVIGDLAKVVDPKSKREVPGVAPAAMQMGRFVARVIERECRAITAPSSASDSLTPAVSRPRMLEGQRQPFRYRDKGLLATIGRAKAVAAIGRLHFAGLFAWLLWATVHILYLIGFRNRFAVMLNWAWAYVIFQPGARLITGEVDRAGREPVKK
jgi:NADH dehydrogenase